MEKIESFNISKKTLIVMDNFSKLLSSEDAKSRKIRITPNWLEVKIAGMVGFYDCSKEENSGFQEFVIAESKKFLDLIAKIGLKEAQFKEPFLYLKNGDTKVKFHTSPLSAIKPIDKKIIDSFDQAEYLVKPFELDLNELETFFNNSVNLMGYKHIKFETKNNGLKIIGYDKDNIDNGFYEESLNVKVENKLDFSIAEEHLGKLIKSNYRVHIKEKIIRLENLDYEGLNYYIAKDN